MAPHPDTQRHPLHPRFAIEIKNPRQAAIYRRLLIAKIVVQVILLVAMLMLLGVTWWQLAFIAVFATAWKGFDMWRKGTLKDLAFWNKWNIPS